MSTKKFCSLLSFFVVLALGLTFASATAPWKELGPDGGDARSLSFDPHNPDRILLGTSSGQLYLSQDRGHNWTRFAQIGLGDDYVLDNTAFDPNDPNTIYVAVWSVEHQRDAGDLYVTHDGGKSWKTVESMRGKSIRALTIAPSNPKIMVAGALDGVYRSEDGARTWQRISPEAHAEIKNIESIAIDPKNPAVIYAGTWHLPWKSEDGGKNWHSIKQGVIDDSDVFSMIVDFSNPANVFASACSGIYKSESSGQLFHKIQGIPMTARRTRVLQQDPVNPQIVYAGTTEGLYKTVDGGKTFKLMGVKNVIVNDVSIDPRDPKRVLLATDRSGVLLSENGGESFEPANRGYSHRQVASVVVDQKDPDTIYAGLLNDRDFGGVYVSHDAGASWKQMSKGLKDRDVFSLQQTEGGTLWAGTNHGIMTFSPKTDTWEQSSEVVKEKIIPAPKTTAKTAAAKKSAAAKAAKPRIEYEKSELTAQVSQLAFAGSHWYAATSAGLYSSHDAGKAWHGGPMGIDNRFLSVSANDEKAFAVTAVSGYLSSNHGEKWEKIVIPNFITVINSATVAPDGSLWMATHEGAMRSTDDGKSWDHVTNGLPWKQILAVSVDSANHRMLATARDARGVYASTDNGVSWKFSAESPLLVRGAVGFHGGYLAITAYNGLEVGPASASTANASQASNHGGASK
jgi:photosystem II stability/assembly factor-like uncharacterized protein